MLQGQHSNNFAQNDTFMFNASLSSNIRLALPLSTRQTCWPRIEIQQLYQGGCACGGGGLKYRTLKSAYSGRSRGGYNSLLGFQAFFLSCVPLFPNCGVLLLHSRMRLTPLPV